MKFVDAWLESLSLSRRQVVPIASVTVAAVTNNLVGFIVNVVAATKLGAEGFGIFSLAYSVATLTGTIGDFGLNLTMIRLFNKYQAKMGRQELVLASTLSFKSLLFFILAIACLPLGNLLARGFDVGTENSLLFAIAFITGGILFFWTYLQSFLQSHLSFRQLTGYILAYAGLRVACLIVANYFFPESSLIWLVATYTIPVTILILFGVLPIACKLIPITFRQPREIFSILAEALHYSKWVALSTIAYASLLNVLRFILAVRASTADVGIFSAGITFAMAFSILNQAMRAVLFPQVTALEDPRQMRGYLKRLRQLVPYYFALALLGIGTLGVFQWFVLGAEYRAALPVFLITASVLSLTLFLGLATMLVHTMMKPQIDAWVNVGRLGIMIIMAFFLIPPFQVLGAAIAYAVPLLIGEMWMFRYVLENTKNQNR